MLLIINALYFIITFCNEKAMFFYLISRAANVCIVT